MALHSPLRKCCEFAPRDLSRSCGQRKYPPDPAMGCTEKDRRDRPRLMQVSTCGARFAVGAASVCFALWSVQSHSHSVPQQDISCWCGEMSGRHGTQILKDVNGRGIAQAAEDSLATTKLWCGLIASD